MDAEPVSPGGWLDSLRRIGESMSALVRSRIELFTVELQEEKLKLLDLLIWLGVAAAVGVSGFMVATIALAFWLWTTSGYTGLIALAILELAVASVIIGMVRRKLLTGPTPFADTVAEFRKDGECLRGNH